MREMEQDGRKVMVETLLEKTEWYIRDHPGCRKSDIYQSVTRNAHTPEKIASMASMGLIEMACTSRSNVTLMSLTDRGVRLTDHLLAAESVLRETLPPERSEQD